MHAGDDNIDGWSGWLVGVMHAAGFGYVFCFDSSDRYCVRLISMCVTQGLWRETTYLNVPQMSARERNLMQLETSNEADYFTVSGYNPNKT